jgi:thioredoxin-like negative regulator of GroEL
MRLIASALLAAALATSAPAAVPAPRVKAATFDQLAKPLPLPYPEAADATAAVNRARALAKAQNKRLLIDLGGNWCGDCRVLAGTMDLPEVKAWLKRHYVLVMVDVGRFDKNLQVPAQYGITERLKGVPSLLVVDPRTDTLLNDGQTAALASARKMSPQGLADYLARWAR